MLSSQARFTPQSSVSSRASRRSASLAARASTEADIYIGFPKGDYQPRQGRQGRFIKDDPQKYPQKDELSGGWAGGEKGLKQFVEVYSAEAAPPPPTSKAVANEPKPLGKGTDTIYIGKGRIIIDDASKYPQRNELTGGFAGGELGLGAFLERGDVPVLEPGAPQRRQPPSPLIVAGAVSVIGTIAALVVGNAELLLQGGKGPGM